MAGYCNHINMYIKSGSGSGSGSGVGSAVICLFCSIVFLIIDLITNNRYANALF